jgi:hypothetical protein
MNYWRSQMDKQGLTGYHLELELREFIEAAEDSAVV